MLRAVVGDLSRDRTKAGRGDDGGQPRPVLPVPTALPELSGAEVYQQLVDTARCSYDEYGNRICVVDLEAAIAEVSEDH